MATANQKMLAIKKETVMQKTTLNIAIPMLSHIDRGGFFLREMRWIYMAIAAGNVLLAIRVVYSLSDIRISWDFFTLSASMILPGLIGAQVWLSRKDQMPESTDESDDFFATRAFSHFTQTLGENLGIFLAIAGFGFSLTAFFNDKYNPSRIADIMFRDVEGEAEFFSGLFSLPVNGLFGMLLYPMFGYFVILVSRFIAEQWRAVATIASNSRR